MLMTDKIELLGPDRFDLKQLEAVATLLCRIWPKPGRTVATRVAVMQAEFQDYAGPPAQAPRGFAVFEGEQAIAYAAILPREVAVEGARRTIAGLARVCSAPELRGRGLGELVVRAAFATVDRGDFPWALFQTTHQVRPFYERLGATVVDNPIVNSLADDPLANPFWDDVVMRYPAAAAPPHGAIDLLGPGY